MKIIQRLELRIRQREFVERYSDQLTGTVSDRVSADLASQVDARVQEQVSARLDEHAATTSEQTGPVAEGEQPRRSRNPFRH